MREENYIAAAWGIFHGAFGRKKQVSSLRELSRSVCRKVTFWLVVAAQDLDYNTLNTHNNKDILISFYPVTKIFI